jgi:hypothetical protein
LLQIAAAALGVISIIAPSRTAAPAGPVSRALSLMVLGPQIALRCGLCRNPIELVEASAIWTSFFIHRTGDNLVILDTGELSPSYLVLVNCTPMRSNPIKNRTSEPVPKPKSRIAALSTVSSAAAFYFDASSSCSTMWFRMTESDWTLTWRTCSDVPIKTRSAARSRARKPRAR